LTVVTADWRVPSDGVTLAGGPQVVTGSPGQLELTIVSVNYCDKTSCETFKVILTTKKSLKYKNRLWYTSDKLTSSYLVSDVGQGTEDIVEAVSHHLVVINRCNE